MSLTLEHLDEEHRLISDLVEALADCASHGGRPRVDLDRAAALVGAISGCLERLHVAKEEQALFPILQERGLTRDHAVVNALLAQHESGHVYLRKLRDLCDRARAGGRDAEEEFVAVARDFGELVREHVRIEDRYFYEVARDLLRPDDQPRLDAALARVEKAVGGPAIREHSRQVLEAQPRRVPSHAG